jgi:hypothetical protein
MSGRFGNRASRGDSGNGPTDTTKTLQQSLYGVSTRIMLPNFYIQVHTITRTFFLFFLVWTSTRPYLHQQRLGSRNKYFVVESDNINMIFSCFLAG